MASRFVAHAMMRRGPSASRAFAGTTTTIERTRATGRRQPSIHGDRSRRRRTFDTNFVPLVARSSSSTADNPSLRRRRKRGGAKDEDGDPNLLLPDDPSSFAAAASSSTAFAPADPATGLPLDSQQYLALASLSPWVPCPDMVVKRALEIAGASSDDVHVDLGCGDGRLNFAAADLGVRRSWGVDVDPNVLDRCRERLGRRFVPGSGGNGGFGADGDNGRRGIEEEEEEDKAGGLEFVQADLISVVERQKEKYQRRRSSDDGRDEDAIISRGKGSEEEEEEDAIITRKLSRSTVVSMYFVDDALRQLRPYLASTLGGKENVRVITIGYEMGGGWEPAWAESVLGLTIFRYDMGNVSCDPPEWNVEEEEDEEGKCAVAARGSAENEGERERNDKVFDNTDGYDVDPDGAEVDEYLRRKREKDMEELNDGLRIHHDERLNDFAQFRHSKNGGSSSTSSSSSGSMSDGGEEEEEDDWDFDETEDPMELQAEAQRIMAEARSMGGRGGRGGGRGLMAGLDVKKTKGGEGREAAKAKAVAPDKPVWKKP